MLKNTAGQKIGAQMITAADGTPFTGAVTVYVTGDAGTQALGSVGSGACTHEGNGYHTYAPAQAETNYDLIAFTFIGTGAMPATVQVFTNTATLATAIKAKTDNLPAAPAATGDCLTAAGVRGALGMSSANLDTQLDAIPTNSDLATALAGADDAVLAEVALVKAKTDNLPSDPADASVIAGRFDTLDTNLGTVDSNVDAIKAKTDNLPSDPADASVIAGRFDTLDTNLGTVDSNVDGIKAKTDNLPASPAATSDIPTAAANADAVWDEATAGHTTGGTFGAQAKTVIDAINAKTTNLPAVPAAQGDIPNAATIADAVWNEDATDHQTQGTFGQAIGDPVSDSDTLWGLVNARLDETISSRASQTSVDDIPTAAEMASALSVIEGKVDTVDGVADAIQAKTDNLPADPAGVSDLPDITTVEMYAEELHRNSGLDGANPLTVTPTGRAAGAIDIEIVSDGGDGWIATRQ